MVYIGVRDGGSRGGGGVQLTPPNIRADTTFIRAKDNTFVWLTVTEQNKYPSTWDTFRVG